MKKRRLLSQANCSAAMTLLAILTLLLPAPLAAQSYDFFDHFDRGNFVPCGQPDDGRTLPYPFNGWKYHQAGGVPDYATEQGDSSLWVTTVGAGDARFWQASCYRDDFLDRRDSWSLSFILQITDQSVPAYVALTNSQFSIGMYITPGQVVVNGTPYPFVWRGPIYHRYALRGDAHQWYLQLNETPEYDQSTPPRRITRPPSHLECWCLPTHTPREMWISR